MECDKLICRQCAEEIAIAVLALCSKCIRKNFRYRASEVACARSMRLAHSKTFVSIDRRRATQNFRDPDTGKEHRFRKGKNRSQENYQRDDEADRYYAEDTVNSRTLYHGENYSDE